MTNKFVLTLDSTQITNFLTCGEMWNLADRQLLQKVGKGKEQEDSVLLQGTYGHKVLDLYYTYKAHGLSLVPSINRALAEVDAEVDNEVCDCGHGKGDHPCEHEASIDNGCCNFCQGPSPNPVCVEFKPQPLSLNRELRKFVKDRCKLYAYNYENSDFIPASPESVEVGFSHNLFEDSERLYVLEGKIDLLGTLQGIPCLMDHKFQASAHMLYPKSIQARNYAMVTGTNMFLYNYIRLTQKVDESTFKRQISSFTAPEHQQWRFELIHIYNRIYDILVHGGGLFDKNFSSCKGYSKSYDGKPRFCQFTDLCEEANGTLKEMKRNQLYEIKKVRWSPW